MGKNKGKQFNRESRKLLQLLLEQGKNTQEIGKLLKIHPSTISREIKKYRFLSQKRKSNIHICSQCQNALICRFKYLCGKRQCKKECIFCEYLNKCIKFIPIKCKIDTRFPHVCNNCPWISTCKQNQWLYDADKADKFAREIRSITRIGVNLTMEEYNELNQTVSQGIALGQSIYHISLQTKVTTKTLYNYVHKGIFDVKPIDLPRAVAIKKRNIVPSKYQYTENNHIDRTGRTYSNWLVYRNTHRIFNYWEMDFLGYSTNSEQCVLTLTIPDIQFIYLRVISHPNMQKIIDEFNQIHKLLGDDFSKVFEAILTDRDPSFNGFEGIETDYQTGEIRTRVFFCDPARSNQKPSVENRNAQIRTIFPKGCLISNLTQEMCDTISSNLNSRYLNSIDGDRAIDLFIAIFGKSILDKLNIRIINPKNVKIGNYRFY